MSMMNIGDTVAYTEKHFRRAFGVLVGCRSRDWAQGRVVDVQTADDQQMVRVRWAREERASAWLPAAFLERIER